MRGEHGIHEEEDCPYCKEWQSKLDIAVDALRRHGYRESCDIPACNCGDQWNHGGHAAQRLSELADVIEHNGVTLLDAAKGLVSRLDHAAKLCEIYFNIAVEAGVTEADIRRKRDAAISAAIVERHEHMWTPVSGDVVSCTCGGFRMASEVGIKFKD